MTEAAARVLVRARKGRGVAASLDRMADQLAPEGRIVVLDGEAAETLPDLLAQPTVAAVDVDCARPLQGLQPRSPGLLLRLATSTILGCDAAGFFAHALARRHSRLAAMEDQVRLALQEAIGNAVMHGNLEVGSALRAVGDDLVAYAGRMAERSASPLHAARSVTLSAHWDHETLSLSVEDEGPGFNPADVRPITSVTAPSGRGLGQIRSVCRDVRHEKGGRRLALRFRLP